PSSGRPCSRTSTAMCEATSPACAPPTPSATANSGERAKQAASLLRRWRPVSERSKCSATLSTPGSPPLLERELAVADADAVAVVQRLRARPQLLVEVGAVGGAEVLEHDDAALPRELGVAGGRERILEADLGL